MITYKYKIFPMPKTASAYYIMKRRLCIQFLSVALQIKQLKEKCIMHNDRVLIPVV